MSPPPSRLALVAALLLAAAGCAPEPPAHWRQHDLWNAAPESFRSRWSTLAARSVRAIALTSDAVDSLSLAVPLGDEPFLTFRPVVAAGAHCRFGVAVDAGAGDPTAVYAQRHEPLGATLPEVVVVDLADFAGSPVTIRLSVASEGPGACEGRFASPRVVDRTTRSAPPTRDRPDVLLIALDTLRADALGSWGRTPSPSPNLDAFADESQVWLDAFSTANNTNPSLASLMTGLYPKDHGVFDLRTRLSPEHTTLAEHFRAAGHRTLGVVSAAHLKNSGLDQGFEEFVRPGGQFFAETVVDVAIDWWQRDRREPAFVWLHFFDAHVPHNPPEPYASGRAPAGLSGMAPVDRWRPYREPGRLEYDPRGPEHAPGHRQLYPGEIAYLDRQLGRLFDFLRQRGDLDRTIVAVVADHGETLGERQSWFRHQGLYDETTHVPLLIRWPGATPSGRVRGLVQHFDLQPTLLAAIGVAPDADARSLRGAPGRDAVFANHANDRGHMIRTRDRLLLFERGDATRRWRTRLFDLANDPRAIRDLTGAGDPHEAPLADRLGTWRASRRGSPAPVPVAIDEAERTQLRALGYTD